YSNILWYRYGRPFIGRREGARGAVAVVKGARPMRGRPDPVNRTPCEQSFRRWNG
ncbi:unnamed protein product, partial [Nesidiocoris tenuis]